MSPSLVDVTTCAVYSSATTGSALIEEPTRLSHMGKILCAPYVSATIVGLLTNISSRILPISPSHMDQTTRAFHASATTMFNPTTSKDSVRDSTADTSVARILGVDRGFDNDKCRMVALNGTFV